MGGGGFRGSDDEAARRAARLWAFAAVVLAILVIAETVYLVLVVVPWNWEVGQDFVYYRSIGERFLANGGYYLPRQLEGPYVVRLMDDVLYPPTALLLFVPFTVLPWIFWWVVPLAVTIWVLRWLEPAPWAWCVMLVLLAWPRAIGAYLFGNTDIWASAGIFAGLRLGWPAVLLTLKPTFAAFALIGIRQRSWWIAAAGVAASCVLMLPLWFDYLIAVANMTINLDYSLGSLPLLLVGVVAWLGSPRRGLRSERRPTPAEPFPPAGATEPGGQLR